MRFSLFLFVLFLAGCATFPAPETPKGGFVRALDSETVALVGPLPDGTTRIYCTGVWVSETEILTASHCAAHAGDLMGAPTLGALAWYSTKAEADTYGSDPKAEHPAIVAKDDPDHDLALLRVVGPTEPHLSARLALESPPRGDHLYFLGHPSGLPWTLTQGYSAAYRKDLPTDIRGPFLQVSGPIWFGNSGGGAFDDDGNLVGIASFILRSTPNTGFYIPVVNIRRFLHAPS